MCVTCATYTDVPNYWLKFRECDSINSKENIKAGYRIGSQVVNWSCVNKTPQNYGANKNLLFIITYEIPRLHLNEFNRKYPGRSQKRTFKNSNSTTVNNNYLC